MTIAVADGLMKAGLDADSETIKKTVVKSLKEWGESILMPDTARDLYGG